MTTNVKEFVNHIDSIKDTDYGDFMRLANVYLIELKKDLVPFIDPTLDHRIDEMQYYVQFSPTWEIDSTKAKVLQDAIYIDELVLGHKQDWESVPLVH